MEGRSPFLTMPGGRRTVQEAIERIGFGWAQLVQMSLSAGVWIADGAELLLIGSVTKAIKDDWDLNPTERGSIVSIVFIGVFFGNLLSGYVGDKVGRRSPILVSFLLIFGFSVASSFATNFWLMVCIRFFVGVSFGVGQPAQTTLSGEIAPSAKRLYSAGFTSVFFALGEMYSAWLIWIDDPYMKVLHWRWLLIMGAIPSAVCFVVAYFVMYESPVFLALHGKREKAHEILDWMRRWNGKPDVAIDFEVPTGSSAQASSWGAGIGIIFGRNFAFTTCVLCLTTYTLNYCFYGGLYAFPQVLPDMGLEVSPAMNLLLGAALEIPAALVGLLLGFHMSRKHCTILALFGNVVSLGFFLWAAYVKMQIRESGETLPAWVNITLQGGYFGFKIFVAVMFLIVYMYIVEVYPTVVRTSGTSVCFAAGRLGAITSPLFFEWFLEASGSFMLFFYVLVGLQSLNIILFWCLPYETRGAILKDHHDEAEPLKP